jgi:hypothetical protein
VQHNDANFGIGTLAPERLDPARFHPRALVSGPQCGADLLGIEQIDVRRIGLDPKRLCSDRLDLADVLRERMWNPREEGRRETVIERDDQGTLRAGDDIDMRRVRAHATVHAEALAEECGTDESGQRRACGRTVGERNVVL